MLSVPRSVGIYLYHFARFFRLFQVSLLFVCPVPKLRQDISLVFNTLYMEPNSVNSIVFKLFTICMSPINMLPKPRISANDLLCEHLDEQTATLHTSSSNNKLDHDPFIQFLFNSNTLVEVDAIAPEEPIPSPQCSSHHIKCRLCGLSFRTRQGRNQHRGKIHHLKKKTTPCAICGKTFANKYAVKFHQVQVHEKATRVRCEECHKDFYNKYELVKHENKHHSSKNI